MSWGDRVLYVCSVPCLCFGLLSRSYEQAIPLEDNIALFYMEMWRSLLGKYLHLIDRRLRQVSIYYVHHRTGSLILKHIIPLEEYYRKSRVVMRKRGR